MTQEGRDGVVDSREPQHVTASARRGELRVAATPNSIWEPAVAQTVGKPTTSDVLASAHRPQVPCEIETATLDLLTRPLMPGETHRSDFERRERELRLLFERLTPIAAFALQRRLESGRSDDKLVVAFERLVVERRGRLLATLAKARRR